MYVCMYVYIYIYTYTYTYTHSQFQQYWHMSKAVGGRVHLCQAMWGRELICRDKVNRDCAVHPEWLPIVSGEQTESKLLQVSVHPGSIQASANPPPCRKSVQGILVGPDVHMAIRSMAATATVLHEIPPVTLRKGLSRRVKQAGTWLLTTWWSLLYAFHADLPPMVTNIEPTNLQPHRMREAL